MDNVRSVQLCSIMYALLYNVYCIHCTHFSEEIQKVKTHKLEVFLFRRTSFVPAFEGL